MIIVHLAGNDLARVLRWGPGYTGGEDPLNLLRDVIDAEEIRLDRWTVIFRPEDKSEDKSTQISNSTGERCTSPSRAVPTENVAYVLKKKCVHFVTGARADH